MKNPFKTLFQRFDALTDPSTARGSSVDRTMRLTGQKRLRSSLEYRNLYECNGFMQNIVDQPAEDATREWITIKTNMDEDQDIARKIENRLNELGVRAKMEELIKCSRIFSRGGMLYYGVLAGVPQDDEQLFKELPVETLSEIDYINVLDDMDKISFRNKNTTDPTKKEYNEIEFSIHGRIVHPSRVSWLVNGFNYQNLDGMSVVGTIYDSIVAQDNALWSVSSLVGDMATKIFKSDLIANLSAEKQGELLAKLKHLMNTQSALTLTTKEDFNKLIYNVTGMKELFDFIFDNLSGVSRIPRNILLGKAHGVVTAGEYDTINYYAQVAKEQENKHRPIIEKIINLIIREQGGEIWRDLGGKVDDLDWEFEFNPLWKLDPVAQADVDLKASQRDEIDFNIAKANPQELRELDKRYAELEGYSAEEREKDIERFAGASGENKPGAVQVTE
jgi:phage-related protein (TIGR01555 family)